MIDHTGLGVSDPRTSRHFYESALAPLGYKVLMEVPRGIYGRHRCLGIWCTIQTRFLDDRGVLPTSREFMSPFALTIAKQVDAFYEAALAAGGKDNGPPGPRPRYHKDYYGAFVLDPDGHNVEAVCHSP